MVEHKLVLFSTVIALWTLITIIKAKLHTPKVEIHRRPKLFHFGCYMYVVRAKLFCLTSFVLVTGLKCSYEKIFILVTEISVAKTEISVTVAARPLIDEYIDIFTKKRAARQDLRN